MVTEIKHYEMKNILIKLSHAFEISQMVLKNLVHGKFN